MARKRQEITHESIKDKDLLTVSEACFYLGVCYTTLMKLKIPRVKLGYHIVFYRKEDIQNWIKEHLRSD